MLIPDRMLPPIIERSAAQLGAVLLDLAVDMDAAGRIGVVDAVRDDMIPGKPPRILRDALSDSITDEGGESARALCYWNAVSGIDLVLRWNEGSGPVSAWIVISGEHVLFTRDVAGTPFGLVDMRHGQAHPGN